MVTAKQKLCPRFGHSHSIRYESGMSVTHCEISLACQWLPGENCWCARGVLPVIRPREGVEAGEYVGTLVFPLSLGARRAFTPRIPDSFMLRGRTLDKWRKSRTRVSTRRPSRTRGSGKLGH
jgi:hypothetical protein